jgi:hypothetical protein
MMKTDYIVIGVFVAGEAVGALLWTLQYYWYSVPVLYMVTLLGVWYLAYRTRWWKKRTERDAEHSA